MTELRWTLSLVAIAVLLVASCREVRKGDEPEPAGEAPSAEEPLLLDAGDPEAEDEPLLLLDDPTDAAEPTGPVADNSRCHVCHANYLTEDIAVVHARAGIGCAKCHGESDEHIADESWASGENGTAPDTMFVLDRINPFCLGCHPKDEIGEREHAAVLAGAAEKKHCTECHGDHRLHERRCKWK